MDWSLSFALWTWEIHCIVWHYFSPLDIVNGVSINCQHTCTRNVFTVCSHCFTIHCAMALVVDG